MNSKNGHESQDERLLALTAKLMSAWRERVTVHVSRLELSYWSTAAQRWVLAAGKRNIGVGASSRDIRLQGRASVQGEDGR